MTEIDRIPLLPEPPLRQPAPSNNKPGLFSRPRIFLTAGLVLGALALGAGGFAWAAGGLDPSGWRQGVHLAIAQHFVARALDSVGASAEQEAKVHDIIAAKFAEIAPDPAEHEAMRKQALDLLAAPTIDRAAVEKMRADALARFDAKSKAFVGGILDIADQLTPAQRVALTSRIEAMAPHGPMGGWGWGGMHHSHPPIDDTPDNAPDKD